MPHSHDTKNAPYGLGLLLNGAFTIIEFVVGLMTGSLALIADATHNLTDSLTLVISYVAQRIGRRLPNRSKTYGYGRVTIVAALFNGGILVAVAAFIASEAIQRLNEPHEVSGGIVAGVAFIGILINGFIAWQFRKQRHDLNAKSAYTNMLYDTLSSIGAMVAGFIMLLTGWSGLDAIVGLAIAGMLLFATFKIIAEALHVLLEGVPHGIDLDKIESNLKEVPNIIDVDDLHVWSISSGYNSLSCHIIIKDEHLKESRSIVEAAKKVLVNEHGIDHSTIEIETQNAIRQTHHEQINVNEHR